MQYGAGTINMLYYNHIFDQDTLSTQIQHRYSGIISASTHIHLDSDNCLETIMLKGEIKKMKELANSLSKNRGIKSIKVNFVSLV
jgi:CopG family nickel-responsive transcriptional regulator